MSRITAPGGKHSDQVLVRRQLDLVVKRPNEASLSLVHWQQISLDFTNLSYFKSCLNLVRNFKITRIRPEHWLLWRRQIVLAEERHVVWQLVSPTPPSAAPSYPPSVVRSSLLYSCRDHWCKQYDRAAMLARLGIPLIDIYTRVTTCSTRKVRSVS